MSLWIRQSIHKITKKTSKLLFLVELVIAGSEIWFSFFDTNSRQDNLSIRIFRISCHFLFDSFYLCQIELIYHCKISYLLCHWVQDGLNSFCVKHGHCYFLLLAQFGIYVKLFLLLINYHKYNYMYNNNDYRLINTSYHESQQQHTIDKFLWKNSKLFSSLIR